MARYLRDQLRPSETIVVLSRTRARLALLGSSFAASASSGAVPTWLPSAWRSLRVHLCASYRALLILALTASPHACRAALTGFPSRARREGVSATVAIAAARAARLSVIAAGGLRVIAGGRHNIGALGNVLPVKNATMRSPI